MKKFGLLACAALFLFLTGCTEEPAPETRVTPTPGRVQVEITALPTATPVPTPTPLFLPRDDKGNLDINQDLENSLEPTSFPLAADTVIMNPPFGAQKEHADRPFIDFALLTAPVCYGIFNKGSIPFLEAYTKNTAVITAKTAALLNIPKQFAFHTQENLEIPVEIVRLERIA